MKTEEQKPMYCLCTETSEVESEADLCPTRTGAAFLKEEKLTEEYIFEERNHLGLSCTFSHKCIFQKWQKKIQEC